MIALPPRDIDTIIEDTDQRLVDADTAGDRVADLVASIEYRAAVGIKRELVALANAAIEALPAGQQAGARGHVDLVIPDTPDPPRKPKTPPGGGQ